jgi:hypothetical protein
MVSYTISSSSLPSFTINTEGDEFENRKSSMTVKKPLKRFEQDEEEYPILPEPQRVEMKLPEQKEFIRSYITLTYSKKSGFVSCIIFLL